ncbi:ABC transporter ATP-binding protein [Halobacillus fulvus]|nr:ABC transporter ATP-binding protein [Halobacillus fulvus]
MLDVMELSKRYGDREVVKNVSFHIDQGEAFGLLGPNGAGKSTTISMICGLIASDHGDIQWAHQSIKRSPVLIKKKIGLVPQEIALYPMMSAKDNLLFWGEMYGLTRREASQRLKEVLAYVGLEARAKDKVETFSGGMKRRINIGAALMHRPELLIMDEPTVGIDPQSRNHILDTVKKLNEEGMTIIYTSHYMEEVEMLCDRVAIMDHGEVIADGTHQDLRQRLVGGTMVHAVLEKVTHEGIAAIEQLPHVEEVVEKGEGQYEIFVQHPHQTLSRIVTAAVQNGIMISSIDVKEPNLESLFLQLTGRSLRD